MTNYSSLFDEILEKKLLEIRKNSQHFEKLAREKNVEIVDLVFFSFFEIAFFLFFFIYAPVFFHSFSTYARTQVDLVKSFPTHIWSQKSASIWRRTDRSKFDIESVGVQLTKFFVTWAPFFRSQTLTGPFSAVSKPIFATKYALESP